MESVGKISVQVTQDNICHFSELIRSKVHVHTFM